MPLHVFAPVMENVLDEGRQLPGAGGLAGHCNFPWTNRLDWGVLEPKNQLNFLYPMGRAG